MNKILVLSTLFFLCAAISATHAQSNPLPLGTVTPGATLGSCSNVTIPNHAMFANGMNCQDLTVSCPNTHDLHAIFGYYAPSSSIGTIVLFSGGSGTMPVGEAGEELSYGNDYEALGYTVVQIEWASAWEDPNNGPGGNVLAGACRPATFLNWISGNTATHAQSTPMCAQGSSAGGAGIAFPLAWYGASTWSGTGGSPLSPLKAVELISGPTLSEIDQGCTYPNALNMTICAPGQYGCTPKTKTWNDNVIYVDGYANAINNWTGPATGSCAAPSGQTMGNLTSWKNMSLVDGNSNGVTATFNYPNTAMHAWVCQSYASNPIYQCFPPHCPNNSASQGNYFYQQFSSTVGPATFKLTGVQACIQEEGVSQGTDPDSTNGTGSALSSIEADMEANCR
jgi:hypothetical protein